MRVLRDVIVGFVVGTGMGVAGGLIFGGAERRSSNAPPTAVDSEHSRALAAPAVGAAHLEAPPPAGETIDSAAVSESPADGTPIRRGSASTPHAGANGPAVPRRPPSPVIFDPSSDLARARVLAARADVRAVIAIRDVFVERARQGSATESVGVKGQIDQLDRYLEEARARRLLLDRVQFGLRAGKDDQR